jgi:antitoxin VapB
LIYIIALKRRRWTVEKAKVFWSGRSQAVRLPKAFRIEGEEVRIRRHGASIVLEPMAVDWKWLDDLPGNLDDDFLTAVEEQPQAPERPAIKAFD